MDAALVQAVRQRDGVLDTVLGVTLPLRFAGIEPEWSAARTGCAVWIADHRRWIGASGSDRSAFLQGMLSNDVKVLAPGQGTAAAFLTQQGKIVADLRVYAEPERLTLDVLAARAEELVSGLNRFLIADDVELDPSPEMQPLIGLSGPASRSILVQVLKADVPAGKELSHWVQTFQEVTLRIVSVAELGVDGFLIAGPSAVGAELFGACAAAGALPLGAEAMNVLRVEAGIPWYGIDMDEDVLLMEVGLDHAVSFTKGCYLGQEVVERVAARGHVNRKLTGLLVNGARVPARKAPVVANGRVVGQVTSAVRSLALDRVVALGYVHRNYLAEGTQLAIQLGDETAEATVTTLPFVKDGVTPS